MDREYVLEMVLRKALVCNRPQQLLTFGGIALAGCLQGEGDFYVATISALASLYPRATLSQCREIDKLIDDLSSYRESRINDIPEIEYDAVFERLRNLVNTIINL